MNKFITLAKKSLHFVKENGFLAFFKKAKNYICVRCSADKTKIKNGIYADVLFINGCYLPHPSRYRVDHQKEQLLACNIVSNEIFYLDLKLDMIKYYRLFVFYRCPHTYELEEFIRKAKLQNKVVFYDIDDLVIDLKYTNQIKYLDTMSVDERHAYDDGVLRMQKLLCMCDGAITTTEVLANELRDYVPEVFINRNVASDDMIKYSNKAIYNRDVLPFIEKGSTMYGSNKYRYYKKMSDKRIKSQRVRIGYFSGSITHNDDIQMILPVISDILQKYDFVEFHFIGELDVPEELMQFSKQVFSRTFVDWTKLPELIASVDINISPLVDNIFNAAKSENKWVEASLVKVPTVASKIGAFKHMIKNQNTGFLCENNKEWLEILTMLINNRDLRDLIALNAFNFVKKNCCSLYTGQPLAKYLYSKMKPNIAFVLPSIGLSGGVLVALKHCVFLKQVGYDVFVINEGIEINDVVKDGETISVLSVKNTQFHGRIDKGVGTLYSTVNFVNKQLNINEKFYLVQNMEAEFYVAGSFQRFIAQQTYTSYLSMKYITISRWCQNWLLNDYGKIAKYAPNGLETALFIPKIRSFNCREKIRILVEGNSEDYYKNVDESFRIVEKLDKNKFEIWYMSYLGMPKKWYYVDKFIHKMPNEKVAKIYTECDILLKSSILESFSYPPLEMMATGGYVVVTPNRGNVEYLMDRQNCLFYNQGNIDSAIQAIEEICSDADLRYQLYTNGIETAKNRDWENCKDAVLALYE